MYSEIIEQLNLGANGLPYPIPIHPNLVHLTLGLFIIGIAFDIVGVSMGCKPQALSISGGESTSKIS